MNVSQPAKTLQDFPPSSVMFQEQAEKLHSNLALFLEVTERIKKHALVMQNNLLPGNIENCVCCPVHCSQALAKATKDKRGPKKKN